ncbi:hypothetical protein OHB05_39575 [Streptomyces sp. NBC_00638]|uniref:hypothetical protein n=1 Tax=Streptomyces sp. NBC_00638 TaxID=2975794 RepID=UPI0022511416|nr:hypothetical protein [Streptomyces sp. NBC_00638]MCX5008644.1 hypothetical protein [Streptomyces sp. NBC_00638]
MTLRVGVPELASRFGRDRNAYTGSVLPTASYRYADAEPGWQAGVEWTLLWIENTASRLTEDRS